ncbi:MAG: rod shape-determining protein MreD [Thermodesulfobacteriota bacterium]
MRNFFIFLPITVIYLSLRTTLLPHLPLPDITLLAVFYAVTRRAAISGAFLAFTLGYVEDVFLGSIIGSASFGLVAAFMAAHLLERWVDFSSSLVRALTSLALSLIKGLSVYLILRSNGFEAGILPVFAIAATTAVVTGFAFSLFMKAEKAVARFEGRAL